MKFVKIHNLDRNVDEHINGAFIARLRDVQDRNQDKCTITFSSGDTMTALGSAENLLASMEDKDIR